MTSSVIQIASYSSNKICLHVYDLFLLFPQVFSYAKVYLGTGGNQFTGEPVHFSYIPDQVLEQAREVTIKLHSRGGRFLKLQLYFAARWIMLSEVIFESGKRKINLCRISRYFPRIEIYLTMLLSVTLVRELLASHRVEMLESNGEVKNPRLGFTFLSIGCLAFVDALLIKQKKI